MPDPGRARLSVSVVVPCYDGERFLETSLGSILGQTRPADEILVVDDGSRDGSRALVERLAASAPIPIRLLTQANQGAAAARNAGIRAATGDLVALLDQDDAWTPEKLALQVPELERDPGLAMVCADGEWCDPSLQPLGRRLVLPGLGASGLAATSILTRGYFVQNSTVVMRRALLPPEGPFEQRMFPSDDYDFYLRLTSRHRCLYLDRPLLLYRSHPGQFSWDRLKLAEGGFKVISTRVGDGSLSGLPPEALRVGLETAFRGYAVELVRAGRAGEAARILAEQLPGSVRLRLWLGWTRLRLAVKQALGLDRRRERVRQDG